jgi:hypothetical protein
MQADWRAYGRPLLQVLPQGAQHRVEFGGLPTRQARRLPLRLRISSIVMPVR